VKDNLGWWGRKAGGNTLRKVSARAAVIFAKDSVGKGQNYIWEESKCADHSWYIITCQRFCVV